MVLGVPRAVAVLGPDAVELLGVHPLGRVAADRGDRSKLALLCYLTIKPTTKGPATINQTS